MSATSPAAEKDGLSTSRETPTHPDSREEAPLPEDLRPVIDAQSAEIAALRSELSAKDREIAALKESQEQSRVVTAVLETKITLLQRDLEAKAAREEVANLVAENERLREANKELSQELYDVQENNPQLQEALADRRELKRENYELHQRVEVLERQLNAEEQPLIKSPEPLPFKRGIFRDWMKQDMGVPLGGQESDEEDLLVTKEDAYRPVDHEGGGGLFEMGEDDETF
jgi:DNA repair exonuclease SbcCD ATPase subunit